MLEEIAGRVKALREDRNGILPPLLLLGVMERVGSNWVSDTLRPVTGQHNEPFRQQVSPGHPLSALNPDIASVEDAGPRLGAYGRYWLVTFAVLARSPLGVASSFARGDLFRRWDYGARYQQMVSITRRARYREWAPVVPDDDPPDLVVLGRLQVLNTLLLAAGLHEHGGDSGVAVIHYETAVLDPGAARASLATLVPEAPGFRTVPGHAGAAATEDTFATTTPKGELTACLDDTDAGAVRAATAAALAAGRVAVPAQVWDRAREWASGGHLYALAPPPRSSSRPAAHRAPRGGDRPCPVRWVSGRSGDLLWRNLLVTNDEFAAFLNELAAAGLPNCLDGSYLLACEMPHERGVRLHCDPPAR